MTTTLNQYRNTINRDIENLKTDSVIELLLKAKRCWDEAAAAASDEGQASKQVMTAMKSMERLQAAIEKQLGKLGWNWGELEERAERVYGKEKRDEALAHRLTAEGSLKMDMGEM